MDRDYGSQSMIAPLRKVLVKRPGRGFAGAAAQCITGFGGRPFGCASHR